MEKQIILDSGIICNWIEIYNINLQTEEIEVAVYVSEEDFNRGKSPVTNQTIKAGSIFAEEELVPAGKTPKILAEEFLQSY